MGILYPTRIKKSNVGDILINVLLIRELSKHDVVYLDGNPTDIIELVSVNNIHKDNILYVKGMDFLDGKAVLRWLKFAKIIPKLHHVFDPPGHYSQGKKYKTFFKAIKYITRAALLKPFNVKILRVGVTMGPFSDASWKFQKVLSSQYKYLASRDVANYNTLLNRGLKNVKLVDDIAILFDAQNFAGLSTSTESQQGKYIILSFRGDFEGNTVNREYISQIIETLLSLIKNLTSPPQTIVFTYQVKEDHEVNLMICDKLKELNIPCNVISEQLTLTKAISGYGGADYVLTNRLHVALLALLNNAPAYVITDMVKHHKIVNVYKDLGLGSMLIGIDNATTPMLIEGETLNTVISNFTALKNQKRQQLQQQIAEMVKTSN